MPRRVQFNRFGGPEVLEVVDMPEPHPGPGQVRVRVHAAGLNPLDAKIFQKKPTSSPHNVQFPSGNGADFAGVVDEVGPDVTTLGPGDEVFGSRIFHAQADFAIVDPSRLELTPAALTIEQAGSLTTTGRTAWASVASLALGPEDIVFVSAAAGGVGSLAVQLAKRTGATVIGSASEYNHDFLRALGVIPVEYGAGMVKAIRAISPSGITAALDNQGRESVDAALALGAPASRINTIADYAAPKEYGTTAFGGSSAQPGALREVAGLVASGELVFPIDSVFPLERVREAYERLLAGHLRGKIVLTL